MSQPPHQPEDAHHSASQGDAGQASPAPQPNDHDPLSAKEANTQTADFATGGSKPEGVALPANMGPCSPSAAGLSPSAHDRVFPIRSVVSVDPNPTATPKPTAQYHGGDYFHQYSRMNDSRRASGSTASNMSHVSQRGTRITPRAETAPQESSNADSTPQNTLNSKAKLQLPATLFNDIASSSPGNSVEGGNSRSPSLRAVERPSSPGTGSVRSALSSVGDMGTLITPRFKHVVTDGGHMVITGRDGQTLQRCEDEPIHMPGAVQGFGLLVVLQDDPDGNGGLLVRVVSENSKRFLGRSPRELFALESFTDILSEEQADNLLDHIDFIKDEESDVLTNGPEVFTISIKVPGVSRTRKLWSAVHINETNPGLIICEFELEDDPQFPLVPPNERTPDLPEDTLSSRPTEEEFLESTEIKSRPLRVLRSARKRKGEAAAMEVFNIMSQVQEQLAAAPSLEKFLKVLVGVVKELTGFHRVMIYQFDQAFNGRVVTELVDPRATKDLYKGLNFPASDIPKQARELYKLNKVRMLYDRDQETARLVCRTADDLETPLDLTHSYLRAMSPIHLKYLANMAVRSSMSISINAFNELWGLIACHSYGARGMRVSFPIRKMCRMVGDSASRNIERLSYASRLQARKLINTVPSEHNPSGYIIASSDDLLKLFDADFGLLSIRDETKILGHMENSQEALAMLEYLRMRKIQSVMTSTDINQDFPDLRYQPGFHTVAGMLIVPLTVGGTDFIVFFRKGQLREVKWAGNPYEKFIKEGTEGYLEPRKSFKTWSETVVGKCREWTEEEIETASVLCLVYGKFIEVWRQKEAALQNSQLTRLLLANSAHEVRTPLNAIINYLEIALEGSLDSETRENLSRSHSASKSLIYVINDLLDLTKTEEGGPLVKGESFDLSATIKEATDMFRNDAKRKNIDYEVVEHEGLPKSCIGDQRRVRQAISNIAANAIQHTSQGGVKIEAYVAARPRKDHAEVEVAVTDTGAGINPKKLDQLFYDLEQVQSEPASALEDAIVPDPNQLKQQDDKTALGLGLALVARIIRNMNGQLRIRSEEGKGTRFVIQFPFDLPDNEELAEPLPSHSESGSVTPHLERPKSMSSSVEPGGERIVISPAMSRHDSNSAATVNGTIINHPSASRRQSADSLKSKTSLRSFKSGMSASTQESARSDVDRLIDDLQAPHLVERRRGDRNRSPSARSMRPTLTKRNSLDPGSPTRTRSKSLEATDEKIVVPPHQRSLDARTPGEEPIRFSSQPLKAVRLPDDAASPEERPAGSILGEIHDEAQEQLPLSAPTPEKLTSDRMRVLVAEDDPVNSRIVKKRLEKMQHTVYLTVNGEECASAFGDSPKDFDVVLMDMQMPIVDGLTSTKMIRSYEKTHTNIYSPRAALCGRVPIVAVSASLIEKDRQQYIDAGFDAWILKPISFDRLNKLMAAIVDRDIRRQCLYEPGQWERGGWFHEGRASVDEVDTRPTNKPPVSNPSDMVEEAAGDAEKPMAGEENEEGRQPEEQERLLKKQEAQRTEEDDKKNEEIRHADPKDAAD
ncbi:Cyanobacterial phytochrome B [Stagonosporopsis vannaccii]|nr:Cyanobacterial phytochrome B [Stagonosporopsis vannaccii]